MEQNNILQTNQFLSEHLYKEFLLLSPNKCNPYKHKVMTIASEVSSFTLIEKSLSFIEPMEIGECKQCKFRTSGNVSDKDVGKKPFTFYEEQLQNEIKMMKQISNSNQLTIFEKMFKPIKKGSLRGSVFSLTTSAIGTGCLSLPKAISFVGIILGAFLIIIMAVFQSYCM